MLRERTRLGWATLAETMHDQLATVRPCGGVRRVVLRLRLSHSVHRDTNDQTRHRSLTTGTLANGNGASRHSPDIEWPRLAASRRPGLSRNWTPALSCATTTARRSPVCISRMSPAGERRPSCLPSLTARPSPAADSLSDHRPFELGKGAHHLKQRLAGQRDPLCQSSVRWWVFDRWLLRCRRSTASTLMGRHGRQFWFTRLRLTWGRRRRCGIRLRLTLANLLSCFLPTVYWLAALGRLRRLPRSPTVGSESQRGVFIVACFQQVYKIRWILCSNVLWAARHIQTKCLCNVCGKADAVLSKQVVTLRLSFFRFCRGTPFFDYLRNVVLLKWTNVHFEGHFRFRIRKRGHYFARYRRSHLLEGRRF